MRKQTIKIILLLLGLQAIGMGQAFVHLTYAPSDSILFNPERGFYAYLENRLTASFIVSLKAQNISLVQRNYIVPQFNNSAFSQSFLDQMQADFNTARTGGIKLIPRIFYTDEQNGADAPLDTILLHIEQIRPLLQKNYDVIAFMDAGFIGAWGEWYFSSHHLNNTNDRRTVLYALLDALPKERCVEVRTPNYKRLILGDNNPITINEAFNGSYKSRIGGHNDCFLADATDMGTYLENGVEGDKNYLHQDNLFVPQSGETCSPSGYSDCAHALVDLARMHWSALNKDYNTDVLNGWENTGCMPEIKRRMGYRLQLVDALVPDSVAPSGAIQIQFKVYNSGFASLYNPRLVEIILRNVQNGKTYRLTDNDDPRFWQPNDTSSVTVDGGIPADMPQGRYELLLHLADPVDSLRYRPEYAIHLANPNIWEASSGYNKFGHQLVIDSLASGAVYTGSDFFEVFSVPGTVAPPPAQMVVDGNFDDWQDVPRLDVAPDIENSGDAINAAADLTGIWVTNDNQALYVSYQLGATHNGSYYYHVFIDADQDTSTGFHSAGSTMGIDLMIENESIWRYTGSNNSWSWDYVGTATMVWGTADPTRVEMAIDREVLASAGAGDRIDLILNVNNLDDAIPDDYAPDAYQQHSYNYRFSVTALDRTDAPIRPNTFQLRAWPNPFNNTVTISIGTGLKGKPFRAILYDLNGQAIREFKNIAGQIHWNGQNKTGVQVGSGIYILKVLTGQKSSSIKLVLIK